jgi:hypothetical protein
LGKKLEEEKKGDVPAEIGVAVEDIVVLHVGHPVELQGPGLA